MIGGVAQRERGTKGGTFYRARKHQSKWLFPRGFLGNIKQSFLTSGTQDVIEHFILEAPVSPDSLGRVTRVWRSQLLSSACLAVSLRVCFYRGARILPPRRQTPGPRGGSGVWVMAPLGNTLMQDVHTLNCQLLMTQQVRTYMATRQLFRPQPPRRRLWNCSFVCLSPLEKWSSCLQPFPPHSSVTRILTRHFVSHWSYFPCYESVLSGFFTKISFSQGPLFT